MPQFRAEPDKEYVNPVSGQTVQYTAEDLNDPAIGHLSTQFIPNIIKDSSADVVGGASNIDNQVADMNKGYDEMISSQNPTGASATDPTPGATPTPTPGPLDTAYQQLQASTANLGTITSDEQRQIQEAGQNAGAQYDPLISQAKREKGRGLGISEVSAGEAGGFMNTQFVGMAAEMGLSPEQARIAGRYGTGGELARIKSEYDSNISNLESQRLTAIRSAEQSMKSAIATGKQADFDNAYKMFEAAKDANDAKLEEANALADRVMKINQYNLDLAKFDYQQYNDEVKNNLESAKLDLDIDKALGKINGAPTVELQRLEADNAFKQLGIELDQATFNEMVKNNSFNRKLNQAKLDLDTSKFEAEKNGEDPYSTAQMVMNGQMNYNDALKTMKYGKQAFLKQMADFKSLNQDAYKETGNSYYKIVNSVGGKTPTQTTVEMVSKMMMANDSLSNIKTQWDILRDSGELGVIIGNIKKKDFTDADAVALSKQLQVLVPTVARGVFGEVGVLTDNDIKLYRSAILDIGDPIKAQDKVFNNLLDTIDSKFGGTLRSAADGGIDVSGYGDSYKEFYNKLNSYRTDPKGLNYSSNPAVYNSVDEFFSTAPESATLEFENTAMEKMAEYGISDINDYFEAIKEARLMKNVLQDLPDDTGGGGGTIESDFNNVGTDTNQGEQAIGTLSEKYESGGDPGAIGYDSTGGYSYGTYQLAHNNAQKFVNQSPYADEFQGIEFNSPEWQTKWKEIAQREPEKFKSVQKNYIQQTHYIPQLNKIVNSGIDVSKFSPVIEDVIWSTAVQHGGNTDVIITAYNDATKKLGREPNDKEFITQIYNERAKRFPSSTPQVQASVKNRFAKEREQALSMLA